MQSWLSKVKKVMIDQRLHKVTEAVNTLSQESFDTEERSRQSDKTLKHMLNHVLCPREHASTIGDDVYRDVEFNECFSLKGNSTVFDVLSTGTNIEGAKYVLQQITNIPIHDVATLRTRQRVLEELDNKITEHVSSGRGTCISNTDDAFNKAEYDVFWMFQDEHASSELKDLYDMVFFKFCLTKPLNNSPSALSMYNVYRIVVSPMIGLVSPVLYFLVPYIVIMFKFKIKISFKTYMQILLETMFNGDMWSSSNGGGYKYFRIISCALSVMFYFQGIFNSFELSSTVHKIARHIVSRMNNVSMFLKRCMECIREFWTDDIAKAFFTEETSRRLLTVEREQTYVDGLVISPFSVASNFGTQLHSYLNFNKELVTSILTKVYVLHALRAVIAFKHDFNASFVKYVDENDEDDLMRRHPVMKIEGLFHPCISQRDMVRNTFELDRGKNAIITGPNAGGKSTFVKSLLINVLLAQTIGVSSSHTCTMTPFANIGSQINIPDSKGYESLFEAEMYRCKAKLQQLKETTNGYSFFIMDEIFNSTNPIEGIAGAYAIAKKMSHYDHCMLIFTTHYIYLTKLKKTNRFENYMMNVNKDAKTNEISYPYTLTKGVSKQYIALELLRKNGFDEDLIDEALRVKDRLVSHRV